MEYYQNIRECLLEIKRLEERKRLLYLFYMQLYTGITPPILEHNKELNYQYIRFKYQYLQEIATSKAIREREEYLLKLNNKDLEHLDCAS